MKSMLIGLSACLLAGSALAVVGCADKNATSVANQVTLTPEKTLTVLRGTQATLCQGVIDMHAAGALVGKNFNTAKATCLQVDAELDSAGQLLTVGDAVGALIQLDLAQSGLSKLPLK